MAEELASRAIRAGHEFGSQWIITVRSTGSERVRSRIRFEEFEDKYIELEKLAVDRISLQRGIHQAACSPTVGVWWSVPLIPLPWPVVYVFDVLECAGLNARRRAVDQKKIRTLTHEVAVMKTEIERIKKDLKGNREAVSQKFSTVLEINCVFKSVVAFLVGDDVSKRQPGRHNGVTRFRLLSRAWAMSLTASLSFCIPAEHVLGGVRPLRNYAKVGNLSMTWNHIRDMLNHQQKESRDDNEVLGTLTLRDSYLRTSLDHLDNRNLTEEVRLDHLWNKVTSIRGCSPTNKIFGSEASIFTPNAVDVNWESVRGSECRDTVIVSLSRSPRSKAYYLRLNLIGGFRNFTVFLEGCDPDVVNELNVEVPTALEVEDQLNALIIAAEEYHHTLQINLSLYGLCQTCFPSIKSLKLVHDTRLSRQIGWPVPNSLSFYIGFGWRCLSDPIRTFGDFVDRIHFHKCGYQNNLAD